MGITTGMTAEAKERAGERGCCGECGAERTADACERADAMRCRTAWRREREREEAEAAGDWGAAGKGAPAKRAGAGSSGAAHAARAGAGAVGAGAARGTVREWPRRWRVRAEAEAAASDGWAGDAPSAAGAASVSTPALPLRAAIMERRREETEPAAALAAPPDHGRGRGC
jgi:hypothetical protein